MNELSLNDTKDYLRKAFEQEVNLYQRSIVINELNKRIDDAREHKNDSHYQNADRVIKERVSNNFSEFVFGNARIQENADSYHGSKIITGIFILAISLLLFIIIYSNGGGIGGFKVLAAFIGLVGAGIAFFHFKDHFYRIEQKALCIDAKRKKEEKENQIEEVYAKQVKEIEENNEKDKEWQKANIQKCTELENELIAALNIQKEIFSKEKIELDEFYSSDVVHKKYRALIPIATINEYFDTGRCSELTGPYGAYNLYESEVKQNTIIDGLKRINQNLEQIKINQNYLYREINNVNNNIRDLSWQLDSCTKEIMDGVRAAGGAICETVNNKYIPVHYY